MENQSDIYHYRYEAWLYDNLSPDEQLMYRHYPARQPSALALKMKDADKYPDRETVSEAEQVRLEDQYLKMHGI